ncbi:MAG: transglycosylase SLT domain-containing protein [Gemmatimonadota bacterium]
MTSPDPTPKRAIFSRLRAGFIRAPYLRVPAQGLAVVSLALMPTFEGRPGGESVGGGLIAAETVPTAEPLAFYLTLDAPNAEVERTAFVRLEEAITEWVEGDKLRGALQVDSILALFPTLRDWRPLVRAELLAPTGDTAAVRRSLEGLDPDTDYASRWGWRVRAESLIEAGDTAAAREVARAQAGMETDASRVAELWLFAGRLGLETGDSAAAREDLWRVLSLGERGAAAQSAARILDRNRAPLPPADELLLGRSLLAGGTWEGAHRRLASFLERNSLSPEEDTEIRLGVARALFEERRYSEAEDLLAPLVATDSTSEAALEAMYWRGRSALERGSLAAADASFRRVVELAPGSARGSEGFTLLLQHELESGFGPRARTLLGDLLEEGVRGSTAETLVVELGTTLYLEGDLEGAARVFEAYLSGGGRPAAQQQASYWAALTHERAGSNELARARFAEARLEDPLSAYGVFAGERIGAPVLPEGLGPGPLPVPGLELELRNAIIRLRVHRLVPTSGSFSYELARLTEHFLRRGDGAYDFGEALVEGGFPLEAIVLGRDLRRMEEEWNLRLLRIVHPLPHREFLLREASNRGLDPFFVAGVIRQESAWDAKIVSASGAVGLMQLMPTTGREVAGSLGIRFTEESLTDPETNLRLGTTYLRTMLDRFDGRAEDALAAYNAGPNRIRQWRDDPAYRDRDVFMEHIPFAETRNYVKVVQQYARIYTALYGCGEMEPCHGLSYPDALARSPYEGRVPGISRAR